MEHCAHFLILYHPRTLQAAARELAEALRQEAAADEGCTGGEARLLEEAPAWWCGGVGTRREAGRRDPTVKRLEDVLATQLEAPEARDTAEAESRGEESPTRQAAAAARRKHLQQARNALAS